MTESSNNGLIGISTWIAQLLSLSTLFCRKPWFFEDSTTFVVLAHEGDGHRLANLSLRLLHRLVSWDKVSAAACLIDLLRKSTPVVEGPHALSVATSGAEF